MFRGGTGDTTIKEDEPESTTLEILLLASLGTPGVQADVHSMEDMDTGGRGLHRMEKGRVARRKQRRYTIGCSWWRCTPYQ